MKLTFKRSYFIAFILFLIIEVLIALFLKGGFIRHTVGDFLVVMLLYHFFKSFFKESSLTIAVFVLCIAYIVEFLHCTSFLHNIGLRHNKWANLIFGNSFSIQDLIAYTLGIIVVLCIDERNRFQKWVKAFFD